MPQVHGACRDAIAYAEWVVNIELNAVTDNPLIFVSQKSAVQSPESGEDKTFSDDGKEKSPSVDSQRSFPDSTRENHNSKLKTQDSGLKTQDLIEVISGGNFHGEPLALSMDYLAIALSELGNISERRLMRLTDESSNAHVLPAFLTEHGGLNSGFMLVQYTSAALCTENKILAHPASVDTIPSSANVEDHVSMGVTSVLKLRQIAENLESILALELFAAAQGIDFRRKKIGAEKILGKGTRRLYNLIREKVPFIEHDTYMKPYIETVTEIVASDEIWS
jgi:histidine ammonia-lyase